MRQAYNGGLPQIQKTEEVGRKVLGDVIKELTSSRHHLTFLVCRLSIGLMYALSTTVGCLSNSAAGPKAKTWMPRPPYRQVRGMSLWWQIIADHASTRWSGNSIEESFESDPAAPLPACFPLLLAFEALPPLSQLAMPYGSALLQVLNLLPARGVMSG